MTIGMLGKLNKTENAYALYLRDGASDWEYIMIAKDKWDTFCNEKNAPVTLDKMRHYLELKIKQEEKK